jgi:DNA repair exonuclease SbcCD ATPase subunit
MDLQSSLLQRLDADPKARDAGWNAFVLAALEGADVLEAQLQSSAVAKPEAPARHAPPAKTQASAFLHSISVQGFRGIGPEATLEFAPGPGLTLVIGRNGCGKSSFAEALELLLTGNTYRWLQRTAVWSQSWRNLHHPEAVISAEFALDGERGPCTVTMRWADEVKFDQGTATAQIQGKPKTTIEALGWEEPLATFRPFLSYNELGSMLDEGPSKLYDALSKILGLDELVDAQEVLQKARTSREKAVKDVRAMRDKVLDTLPALQDERAQAVAAAVTKGDYDAAEKVLEASAAGGSVGAMRVLRDVAALAAPGAETLSKVAAQLRAAGARVREASGTVAARSRDLADVLDRALHFHERHGDGACPVCGRANAMTAAWHEKQAKQAKELRDAAREVDAAQSALTAARSEAQRLSVPRADLLEKAAALELDPSAVSKALDAFTAGVKTEGADDLAQHLELTGPPLQKAVEELRRVATAELGKREDAWRPVAIQLTAWLPQARDAVKAADAIPQLKKAEDWLKRAAEEIRNERFDPIAQRSIEIWKQLRLQSNVELGRITLERSGKQRRVDLHVQVDGVDGAALGVMSQGELHCLALSLFIPRATLAESPFRFVVIDDPVQSMDPARVDGLARVLAGAARDRQVVVFTHDDRLPDAVRRLGIPARTIEVMRREGSVVQPRAGKDPIDRNIEDAMALARTDALPSHAARRVVPGFCRAALEAACAETIRRKRLGRGEPHAEVTALLEAAGRLSTQVALALFDDPKKEGEVLGRLNKERPSWADVYRWCNEGTHEEQPGPMEDRINDAKNLARWLQERP